MSVNQEDLALVNRILEGDVTACNVLVYRYQSYVYTLVMRMLKHKEDAEEVTQDVFIKSIRNMKTFRQDAKLTTWLYRIAYNESVSYLRRRKLWQPLDETVAEPITASLSNDLLGKEERKHYINAALAELQAEDAAVLTMFYLQELSLEEMAQITGQQAANLKVRLHRARKRMLKAINSILAQEMTSLL